MITLALLVATVAGCDRNSAELAALREENERLRKALDQERNVLPPKSEENSAVVPKADLDLPIAELWAQRFEDNQFRSKQRLDQKQIRVTGRVESVFERSVTIFGTGTRFGSVSLLAQLDEAYIAQISDGLAALQKGTAVTIQGRFVYDKMWLQEAVLVDRETGKRLVSQDLMTLAESPAGPSAGPEPESQKTKPDNP